MPIHPVFEMAARALGWKWSAPFGGLINEGVRRPDKPRGSWESYRVAVDAEDACDLSGVETVEDALQVVAESRMTKP